MSPKYHQFITMIIHYIPIISPLLHHIPINRWFLNSITIYPNNRSKRLWSATSEHSSGATLNQMMPADPPHRGSDGPDGPGAQETLQVCIRRSFWSRLAERILRSLELAHSCILWFGNSDTPIWYNVADIPNKTNMPWYQTILVFWLFLSPMLAAWKCSSTYKWIHNQRCKGIIWYNYKDL